MWPELPMGKVASPILRVGNVAAGPPIEGPLSCDRQVHERKRRSTRSHSSIAVPYRQANRQREQIVTQLRAEIVAVPKVRFCVLALVLISCGPIENSPRDRDPIEGVWRGVTEEESVDGVTFGVAPDNCTRDNVWNFRADGTLLMSPGLILCSGNPDSLPGTWERPSESQLLVGFDAFIETLEYTIVSIGPEELAWQFPTGRSIGQPQLVRQTLVRDD